MNVFNRVLVVVLSIVVLVGAAAALLTSLHAIQPQVAPHPWLVDRLLPFAQLDATLGAWTMGVSLALIVLALLLLVLELRPEPRPPARITLKEDGLGRVTVALDGIRELADREAGRVSGVMRAHSRVVAEPQGVRIAGRVSVDPACSVPDITRELQSRLKDAVEHHVGLAVTEVSVDAQVAPLVVERRARRRVQ
jgi:hypothetical protein